MSPRDTHPILSVLLLAVLGLPMPAEAARLRGSTTLTTAQVTIADLWDDAGPDADRVLGPGPGLGGHITVEASQLAAIARQFGVDWRPASPAERAALDRPGQMLSRDAVTAALRIAIGAKGAPDDCDIELPGYTPPMVPVGSKTGVDVEQVDYETSSGRFTATLAVGIEGSSIARQRLVGRAQEMVELPTLTRRLAPGVAIEAADIRMTRLPAAAMRGEPVRLAVEAIGFALHHSAIPGQPLARVDLMRPIVVEKGARVTMELQVPGLALVTMGQAVESGGIGDRVAVLNPTSRAIVQADIVAAGRVRVMPNSLPIRIAADAQFANLPAAGRLQ